MAFSKIKKFLCGPELFMWTLLWLISLLVIGTIAQKYIGLEQAQARYFSSWFIWALDAVPLPAGRLTLAVCLFNVTAKLVLASPFTIRNSGIIIAHSGAFFLLLGGVLTAYFSTEGSISLREGGSDQIYAEYDRWELAVIDESDPRMDVVTAFSGPYLQPGKLLKHEKIPFDITFAGFAKNSEEGKDGPAGELKALPVHPEREKNRAVALFQIEGLSYRVREFSDAPLILQRENAFWRIEIRRRHHILPFQIHLVDFRKEMHPNTQMARSYESEVRVREFNQNGESEFRSVISMNHPLRLRGFTLYQQSFIEDSQGGQVSVLAVVKNAGRVFPYVSSIIICIGMLWHLLLMHAGVQNLLGLQTGPKQPQKQEEQKEASA